VPVKAPLSDIATAVTVPLAVMLPALTVLVNVGLSELALLLTAVWMLLNSVSNSVPRTTLAALPVGKVSLAVKLVVLV